MFIPECPFTPYKINFKNLIKKFKLTAKTKHLSSLEKKEKKERKKIKSI